MLEIMLCAFTVYGLFSAAVQLWLLLWGGGGTLCVPLDSACSTEEACRKLDRARRTAFAAGLGMPAAVDRGAKTEVLNAVRNAGYTVISVGKEGGEHSDTAKK